jgi:integrase
MPISSCAFAASWPEPWQHCLSDFLHHCYYEHSQSLVSQENYRYILQQFFTLSDKPPEEITTADIRSYLRTRVRPGKSGPIASSTRNTRLGILNAFYKYAASYVPQGGDTPLYGRSLPTLGLAYGRAPKRYRALSEAEVVRLFKAIPNDIWGLRDKSLFLAYLYTTRRRNELLRLTWNDIERGVLRDDQGHMYEGWIYHFKAKGSGQEELTAELPDVVYQAICRYLEAVGRLATIEPNDPIWTPINLPGDDTFDESKPLTGSTVLRRLKAYAHKAGIPAGKVTIHSFRHTSIQQRLLSGQGILDVMGVTRHGSLSGFMTYAQRLQVVHDSGAVLLQARFSRL